MFLLGMMSNYLNLMVFVAVIPAIILMVLVYQQDKIEHEPVGLIIRLFLYGCASTFLAMILEMIASRIITAAIPDTSSWLYLIINNFIGVAIIEEGCKLLFCRLGTWNNPEFNYRYDGIVYAVAVSLGFAALENIEYVFNFGIQVAPSRGLLAIPLHCICGIFMGHFYGQAKMAEVRGYPGAEKRNNFFSLFVPMMLHGFYDFAASSENDIITIIFFVYVIVLDIIAFRSVRKFSREDMPLSDYQNYQDNGFNYWR